MEKYVEAIEDCLKSIEIDSSYSKAYSRLGLAYYNQGNYTEALEEGFLRGNFISWIGCSWKLDEPVSPCYGYLLFVELIDALMIFSKNFSDILC